MLQEECKAVYNGMQVLFSRRFATYSSLIVAVAKSELGLIPLPFPKRTSETELQKVQSTATIKDYTVSGDRSMPKIALTCLQGMFKRYSMTTRGFSE